MTDEEITGVVTSIEPLTNQFTPMDIRILNRVSVVQNQPCVKTIAEIVTTIMILKNQLLDQTLKN